MKWLLAALLVLIALVAGAASWLLYSESGLHWAAARAQEASAGRLTLEGLHGALAREMRVELLQFQQAQTRITVRNAQLRMELLAFLGQRAGIRWLSAELLDVNLGPPEDKPLTRPDLPFGLRIDRAEIARIRVQRGAEIYVIEQFELRELFVRESGAISASSSFLFPHERYPVRAQVRLDGSHAIDERMLIEPSPGHTPGHVILKLSERGEHGVFCGDVIHHPVQVYAPHWNSSFCEAPDEARATRRRVLEHCAEQGALLFPTHFGAPHVVGIHAAAGGFSASFVPGRDA